MKSMHDRLFDKVLVTESCWLWTGALNEQGYGLVNVGPRGAQRLRRAHRLMYELRVGPIGEGLAIDHLCRVRHCVNPDHLEPVTTAENNRRMVAAVYAPAKTCKRGHPWSENGVWRKAGYRACMACHRENAARRRYL